MCISNSVGRNGINGHDDVKTAQIVLNMNLRQLIPLKPLSVDGGIGGATIAAIEEFQRRVLAEQRPDGRIDPSGKTWNKLREGLPYDLTADALAGIMINASVARIGLFHSPLSWKMEEYGIDTPLRMAHFLAQVAHESAQLRYTEEIASGAAYEGRVDLGNTQAGDGIRFKGRGLIQLTGRHNYTKYSAYAGTDHTVDGARERIATDPWLAVDVSCWFWDEHGLSEIADTDDVMAVTKVVNGGYNGIDDRKAKLARAKFFLRC